MHRTSRRGETHRRPEPHRGPQGVIALACVAAAIAALAVVALPVFVPKASTGTTSESGAHRAWDATGGGAQAGMDSISHGTQAANSARLSPDPVATVRDASIKYRSTRLAEIRDELAKIDAADWKSQKDLDRRQALLDEQGRLLSR